MLVQSDERVMRLAKAKEEEKEKAARLFENRDDETRVGGNK